MKADCHVHFVLDGVDWKPAIARHAAGNDEKELRQVLKAYQEKGYTYLRSGGDRWGTGSRARALAGEYGIRVACPLAPLHKKGHYGGFIGLGYGSLREYASLVKRQAAQGADFVKIMISGLMDFDRPGKLTQPPLPDGEIKQIVHIAKDMGFSVMAHCNGAAPTIAAAEAGVDSIEHGAYLNGEALAAMEENRVVWVPTLSTIGNLLGKGRYPDKAVEEILDSALANISRYSGFLAPGTDAGAWAVPHGCGTEEALLARVLGEHTQARLEQGIRETLRRFPAAPQ